MALNCSPELYLLKAGVVPGDTLGHFWPQGHNLNKLGRGPLGDAIHTNYQDFSLNGFRQEDFFMFSPCKHSVKYVPPVAGPFFGSTR